DLADVAVELLGEDADPLLLPVGAAHGVGPAVDIDGDGRHQRASLDRSASSPRMSRTAPAARPRASAASRPALSSPAMRARSSSPTAGAVAGRALSSSIFRSSVARAVSIRSLAAVVASAIGSHPPDSV